MLKKIGSFFGGLICTAIVVGGFWIGAQNADANEPRPQVFSETHDFGSLVDAAGETNAVAIRNARLGDFCLASLGVDSVDLTLTCTVVSATSAEVRLQNESGSTADLASTTVRVIVFPRQAF